MTIKERIAQLEAKVDDILSNHLPHLDIKIDKIADKLDHLQWFILSTLAGILVSLLIQLWK